MPVDPSKSWWLGRDEIGGGGFEDRRAGGIGFVVEMGEELGGGESDEGLAGKLGLMWWQRCTTVIRGIL